MEEVKENKHSVEGEKNGPEEGEIPQTQKSYLDDIAAPIVPE